MSSIATPGPVLRIGVILASTWRARGGESLAKWIHRILVERPGVDAELLDLRDYRFLVHAREEIPSVAGKRLASGIASRWSEKIHGLDGYVFVTPEYNQVYPGQLKNAIDHVAPGWWYKPVAFVSYGGSSLGTRAVEQLSGFAVETRMVPVRSEVNVRLIELQANEAGRPPSPYYARTASSMIDELLWWAQTTKVGRASVAPPGL